MSHIDPKRDGLYQQETKVVAEGVRICKRADHKSGHWQAHITVPGQKVPYRKSTKTSDPDEAARCAQKIKLEVELKLKHDMPLTDRRVSHVAESFIEHLRKEQERGHMKKTRVTFLEGTLRRYVIPYFGKMHVASITEREIERFREWRKDNGKGTKSGTRTVPKLNTLRFEESALRQMFDHAVQLGVIGRARVPRIRSPKKMSDARPGLTAAQWKKLCEAMDASVAEAKHPHDKHRRELLRGYVRFMVATGLRPGEARVLCWEDVEDFTTKEGKNTIRLKVTGKTGKRECIAQPTAKLALDDVKGLTQTDQGPVFTLNGEPVKNFGVGFGALLRKTGLATDTDGTKRTIYSLRHTYATFRLEAGVSIHWLAENMGTSVQMIERHYAHTRVSNNADDGIKGKTRKESVIGFTWTEEDADH